MEPLMNPLPHRRAGWIRWAAMALMVYVLLGAALYVFQDSLVFQPRRLPASYSFQFSRPFREINLPINDTDRINCVLFTVPHPRGLVLYFHGSAGNLTTYVKYLPVFLNHGYEVLLSDYPGYGKSRGNRSEADLYRQAGWVYQLALNYVHPDSLILYGKSLGSAMASYLARHKPCKALILECPLYNNVVLAGRYFPIYPVSWMLKYRFPVNRFIQKTAAPILIFHGTRDRVIPFREVSGLIPSLKSKDRFVSIPGGGHSNLYASPIYQHVMDSTLNR